MSQDGGRIDGFTQALDEDTPISQAKAEILAELPPDTRITAYVVINSDADGNGCSFMNIQSASLAKWLGPNPWGDPSGTAGIEFYTVTANASQVYDADNTNTVTIDLATDSASSGC